MNDRVWARRAMQPTTDSNASDGTIDAFRVAAREMFFNHSKDMKPYLKKTIMLANDMSLMLA